MATSNPPAETHSRFEDVLTHLPASKTMQFSKGQTIYGSDTYPRSIYLVIKGTVGISQLAEDGTEVLLDIVRPEELFGESAFLEETHCTERAEAIETVEVMNWTVPDMEDLVMKRPRLAVAMLQVLAQRNADYRRRIESFAIDSIERRLARSLLRFSERLGTSEESGSVTMIPLTQEMLSRHIGTSREIVSHHMNRFRKNGYVSYSRRGICLHRETLRTVLD